MIIRYEKKTGWILSIMEDFVPEPEPLEGTELLKISNEDAPENFRNIYATENGYKIINGEIRKKKNLIIRVWELIMAAIKVLLLDFFHI
jgi:hypothetical protein